MCLDTLRYVELVFLHLVGSAGHIVHSGARMERNINALFSYSGGPGVASIKYALGHVMSDLCFCFQWHLRVT
jgi:hypothetical protein